MNQHGTSQSKLKFTNELFWVGFYLNSACSFTSQCKSCEFIDESVNWFRFLVSIKNKNAQGINGYNLTNRTGWNPFENVFLWSKMSVSSNAQNLQRLEVFFDWTIEKLNKDYFDRVRRNTTGEDCDFTYHCGGSE